MTHHGARGTDVQRHERGILFKGFLVRKIQDGTKTQTRRLIRLDVPPDAHEVFFWAAPPEWVKSGAKCAVPGLYARNNDEEHGYLRFLGPSPYGAPGDRLRVKEDAWMYCERRPNGLTPKGRRKWRYVALESAPVLYCADHPEKPQTDVVHPTTPHAWGWRKKVARFVPLKLSRITLDITEVRVQRVQDISEEDAKAEGLSGIDGETIYAFKGRSSAPSARAHFAAIWDEINAARGGSWQSNPWVWALTFKRVEVTP